jgi:hypothetical protein
MTLNFNQQVNNLHFTVKTGGDDVRSQSQVNAVVTILEGEQINIVKQSLNDGANWSNDSTHEADMRIPLVRVRDIRAFRIDYLSGQSSPSDSEDNWDMVAIQATFKLDSGGDDLLFKQDGQPLHRFTGSDPTWEMEFNWSA